MAIEAILWDFGGVFTSSPFEAFNRYEARRGLPKDFIRKVNSTNPESNAWALFECSTIDARQFDAAVMQLFDAIIESSKTGLRKPNPKVYLMMCERLGVSPRACVYLDDLGINCKPAAQLGMVAIKVVTEDQTLAELARVTGVAF